MFGLNPWLLLGAFLAFASYSGVLAYKVDSAAVTRTDAKWSRAMQAQTDEAQALILKALEDKAMAEKALAALNLESEAAHARESALLNSTVSVAKYNRLGLVFERLKAGCRPGGGGTEGDRPAGPAVAGGGPGPVAGEADVPGADDEGLGDIAQDADQLRIDFLACSDHAIALPGLLND